MIPSASPAKAPSASGLAALLGGEWPEHVCASCGRRERLPVPPAGGVCHLCRSREDAARRSLGRMLRRAGAPPEYARTTRATWEAKWKPWAETPGFDPLLAWIDRPEPWLLLLWGRQYGRRKTGLGTAVFGELLARGRRGAWVDQGTWLRTLQGTFGAGAGNSTDVFNTYARADVLLFDDLGSATALSDSAWWRVQVAELLRTRHALGRPTIATTNLDWRELGAVHESLVSRIAPAIKFEMSGPIDWRSAR